jgi:hypothetical protein
MVSRKIVIVASTLIAIVVIAAVSTYFFQQPKLVKTINLGGAYNANAEVLGNDSRGYDYGFITYTKDGVKHTTGYYHSCLNSSMSWIKNNIPTNAVFLNWWDYGRMIVALAERDSVIKNPSQGALISVGPEYRSSYKEFDSNQSIVDVATALATSNENVTKSMMEKYGATYLLIPGEDAMKATWFYNFAGLNSTDYFAAHSEASFWSFVPEDFTDIGKQTMVYRLGTNTDLSMFTQVYSDADVRIFKLTS